MRLSDVMSAMHLTSYAEVALVIFLTVFTIIAIDLFRNKRIESARFMPFEDGTPETHPSSPTAEKQP
ncbi:MAG TPA: hypothetical protein VFQ61_11830 [Polyangiaceae bacterium]|nr:hypothetical protein [Polyangiaceae bacterium]